MNVNRRSMLIAWLWASTTVSAGCATDPAREASHRPTLYMDVHDLGPGKVTAQDVAEAHEADLAAQHQHGVRFVRYWVDEEQGKVYCLSEAPHADAVVQTHREAHGLLPTSIGPVTQGE